MKTVRIGGLRHHIAIQEPTETQDDRGAVTVTWETIRECRAWVEPMRGQALYESFQVHGRVTHRVRLRYWSELDDTMRILFGTRVLNILSVINVGERNVEMEITCAEET